MAAAVARARQTLPHGRIAPSAVRYEAAHERRHGIREAIVASKSNHGGALVLIVEDDEDSRFVYRAILEDQGFDVVLATSGDEGLRIARERRPAAILMDVSIPGMDGWTATQRLKADPDTASIPVIVITAHAFPEDRRRAETVGSDGFLTKPCEPRDVLAEIERQIRASEV